MMYVQPRRDESCKGGAGALNFGERATGWIEEMGRLSGQDIPKEGKRRAR